jgi:hypothetical protein
MDDIWNFLDRLSRAQLKGLLAIMRLRREQELATMLAKSDGNELNYYRGKVSILDDLISSVRIRLEERYGRNGTE